LYEEVFSIHQMLESCMRFMPIAERRGSDAKKTTKPIRTQHPTPSTQNMPPPQNKKKPLTTTPFRNAPFAHRRLKPFATKSSSKESAHIYVRVLRGPACQ